MSTLRSVIHAVPVIACTAALAAGCGKKPEPVTPVSTVEDEGPTSTGPEMAVMGDIGGLNQDQVERVFKRSQDALMKCVESGARRVEYLGGTVSFYLLIDQAGKVVHSHLKESTLGDRQTERCMLDALARQSWPKPVGGEKGKAEYDGLEFPLHEDVREPIAWDAENLEEELGKLSEDIAQCKGSVDGTFTATMYVDTSGQPLAVGMTPPGEDGGEAIDCLVELLMGARFPSPGSWAAKVTFGL